MGILSRMFRLFKADVHGVMDQLEDKGLILKQCLREMETSLGEKQARLEVITRDRQRIEEDLAQHQLELQKLETDLDLAVCKDKDDIARMLIRKRLTLQGSCEQLACQLDKMAEEKNQLAEIFARQRLQYDQLKIKAADFYRRADQRGFEGTMAADVSGEWKAPTEEEVELELLRRKEAQGGGS